MNSKISFIFSILLSTLFYLGNAQVANFTFTPPSGGCNNNVVNFSGTASNSTVATSFTFNGGALPAGWSSSPFTITSTFCPGKNTPDNSNYFWATNTATSGPNEGLRFVQTNAVNVALGGNISFLLRYAADEAPGAGCEDPEQPDEEVILQYSTNGGTSWTTIFDQWDTNGSFSSPWYNWYAVNLPIPVGAQTASTIFRWYQPSNDGDCCDNWGLEDVNISSASSITAVSFAWNFGDATTANTENVTKTYPVPAAGTTATYNVTLTTVFSDSSTDSETKTYVVNSTASAPTASAQSFCNPSTVANLVASGVNLRWYNVPSGGVALVPSSSISTGTYYVSQTTANGCESARTAVTVTFIQANVITRPVTVQLNAAGNAIVTATQVDNGSTWACGIASMSVSPNTFTCANVGANTVTLTLTDSSGTVATGTATVTVQDTIAPIITCPTNIAVNNGLGVCGATVTYSQPTITDNCGGSGSNTLANVLSNFTANSNTILATIPTPYLFAMDGGSNSISDGGNDMYDGGNYLNTNLANNILYSQNTITNSAAFGAGGSYFTSYTTSGGTAMFILAADINSISNFSITGNIGADGGGSFDSSTFTITVNGITYNCFVKRIYNAGDPSVNQIMMIPANASASQIIGTNTDDGLHVLNNINASTRIYYLLYAGNGGAYINNTQTQAIAQAFLSNTTTSVALAATLTAGLPSGSVFPIGTTTNTFSTTDGSGNTSTCSFNVVVTDNQTPTVITQNITAQLDAAGNATITAAQINNGSTDNCAIATVTVLPSTFNCANVGANTVTLTVTDVNGNVATGTAVVTVLDSVLPTVQTQNLTVQLDAAGNATINAAQINNGSTDICGINTVTVSPNTFTCANVGANTVALTVTDSSGNTSTGTATVTVQDTIAPTVTCPGNILVNSALNVCGAAVTYTVTTSDNCTTTPVLTTMSFSGTQNFGSPFVDQGMTVTSPQHVDYNWPMASGTGLRIHNNYVTNWTYNGTQTFNPTSVNIVAGSMTFIAQPSGATFTPTSTGVVTFPNTAAWKNLTSMQWNNNSASADADIDDFVFTNAIAAVATQTSGLPSGSVFPVGTTTNTFSTTDASGNTSTCSFNVVVTDNQTPTVTTQNITAQLDAGGNATITATQINNSSTDNCGIDTVTVSPSTFTCANVGANTVTLTVTDVNGNVATGTAIVTVQDVTAPSITCAADVITNTTSGCIALVPNVPPAVIDACATTVTVNGLTQNSSNVLQQTVDCSVNEFSQKSYRVYDLFALGINSDIQINNIRAVAVNGATIQANIYSYTGSFSGTTLDMTAATLIATSNSVTGSGTLQTLTFPAHTIAGASKFLIEITNLSTAVRYGIGYNQSGTDASESYVSRQGCVDAPTKLSAFNLQANKLICVVNAQTAGAQNLVTFAGVPLNFEYPVGTTTTTYTVTDASGNSSSCNRLITVQDIIPPTVITQNVTVQLDALGNATVTPSQVNNGSTDNCSIDTITVSPNAFTCSNVGANTVTLTITDVNGNVAIGTAVVTVQDTVLPTVITQNLTVQLDTLGNATITEAQINSGSTDNCGIDTVTVSPNAFTCANVGTNTVTLTVTDVNGNVATATAIVTVQDTVLPAVITQNLTVQLNAAGNATITAAQINNGSTDNCGIDTVTVSPSTFTCANVGTNTVTLTIIDVNGNVATGTAVVTVQDTIFPTVVTQNLTVQLNASGNATITDSQINNGSTDNCGIATVTVSPNTFNCTNLGNNTVTLTVTDVNGNVSTATATVLVRDQINPVVIAQNATLALGANGMVTLNPSLINNGSSDNCTFTLTATPNTFGAANVGPNTVILVATDSSGNVSFATAIVTIIDNTPPTVLTQNITVQLDATGNATITAVQINNGSTDNTSIASMSVAASAFTCANLGANTVTLTVTDLYGNVGTNTAIVTVVDSILPTITAPANVTVNTDTGCTATGVVLGTAVTADNCSVASVTNNAPTVFPLGVTMVTWTVTDGSGNIRTATQAVRVNDIINPTITAPSNVVVSANNSCNAVNVNLGTPVSADNCTVASVTSDGLSTYPLGVTTVTWTVTDGSGNAATVTQTVTVNDTTLPTIVAPAALTVSSSATCGVTALELGTPFTNDNCSVATVTNDAPTTFPLGNTTVTWTVTDGAGNIRTATQVVTVVDTTLPTITAPANIVTITDTGCTATGVVLGTAVTADNCSVASVTNNAPAIFPLGTTTVTWTVTDGSGNIRTAIQTVVVNDNVNPTITAPANVVVSANNNCVAVNVNLGTPVSADNCSVASVTNNGLSTYPLGTTTVTWTVTDGSGNTATVTQTVTVNDTTLPTIIAPAALTVSSSATCGVTGLALGTPFANDNCSVATVTNNAPTTFPLGNTTVTWTVTDGAGNIRTATQVVTVVDTTLPTITAPANIVTTTNTGCTATGVVLGTAVTADNCSVASVTNNAPIIFPLGTTTVTWTVTDGSGNIRTATQTVRVNDNVNPTITAPANVTVASNNNCVAVNVNLGTPVRADNCSVASVTNNGLSSYPIGVTIVTWTVTDGSGNTATSTQTVTVVDAVLPTIVAPAAINVNTNSTSCTATNVPLGFPVAIDNCSVASVTNNAPVAFPLGNTTVTWTVTDGSGNTATATQVVTVRDASAPVVITQNISAFLNAAGTVTITAAQVNNGSLDNCGIASVVVTPTTFNCSKLGANVVTLIVTDVNGNVASGTAIVTVVDNLAPTAVTQNITAVLNPNGQVTITAAMVNNGSFDNCSVASVALSKTVFDCSNVGTNTVLFTVTDGSGNTTTVPVQVTVAKRFGDVDNVCGDININVSQAITPNGDGVNDTWMISNIESYPKNNVKVFNRWGSEVFSANGYRNDWNGHYKNSDQSLPDASSYYYQIDLDGDGTIEKEGWIYISRL